MRLALNPTLVILILLSLAVAGFLMATNSTEPTASVELSKEQLVARGSSGGAVVPASCPSFEHFTGECSPPSFSVSGGGGSGPSTTVNSGSPATLSWQCQNSSSSAGVNFDTAGQPTGAAEVTPADTTTYTIVCSNGGTGSVTVNVVHPDLTITANPNPVRSSNTSVITWSSTNTNSCSVTGPSFSASGISGSQATAPITVQSTYTLTCQTPGGSVAENVVVNLIPAFEEL